MRASEIIKTLSELINKYNHDVFVHVDTNDWWYDFKIVDNIHGQISIEPLDRVEDNGNE